MWGIAHCSKVMACSTCHHGCRSTFHGTCAGTVRAPRYHAPSPEGAPPAAQALPAGPTRMDQYGRGWVGLGGGLGVGPG